jgi:transglutaminase-like putative cysteine protease
MTEPVKPISRRAVLQGASVSLALSTLPRLLRAEEAAAARRTFDPKPGTWRNFEVVTTVQLQDPLGDATVWVPVPAVSTHWQRSLSSDTSGNAAEISTETDAKSGARFVVARFAAGTPSPVVQITSRVQTMDRAVDWKNPTGDSDSAATLRKWVQPSDLVPTDGIVRKTALQITQGARTDVDKVRRIYDWIIVSTYREPKVRGCGLGNIKWLLETGDLGGKCADINALMVGLCRAVGVPARDAYGLRLAPSAFLYKELGSNSASLKSAQHCRSEVYLQKYGWVAMDPADVDKVMRQETSEWIKDAGHPLVVPVRKALFGGWEGNWMAYNNAVDVTLPGSTGHTLPFLMYPQAQSGEKRYDSYDPDNFKYTIAAHEIKLPS